MLVIVMRNRNFATDDILQFSHFCQLSSENSVQKDQIFVDN